MDNLDRLVLSIQAGNQEFNPSIFVNLPPLHKDEFICLICHIPDEFPTENLLKCNAKACKINYHTDCMVQWRNSRKESNFKFTCPVCKMDISRKGALEDARQATIRDKIKELQTFCPTTDSLLDKSGDCCQWRDIYSKRKAHFKSCGFALLPCPIAECGQTMRRSQLVNHLKNLCDFYETTCDKCQSNFLKKDKVTHQKNCQPAPTAPPVAAVNINSSCNSFVSQTMNVASDCHRNSAVTLHRAITLRDPSWQPETACGLNTIKECILDTDAMTKNNSIQSCKTLVGSNSSISSSNAFNTTQINGSAREKTQLLPDGRKNQLNGSTTAVSPKNTTEQLDLTEVSNQKFKQLSERLDRAALNHENQQIVLTKKCAELSATLAQALKAITVLQKSNSFLIARLESVSNRCAQLNATVAQLRELPKLPSSSVIVSECSVRDNHNPLLLPAQSSSSGSSSNNSSSSSSSRSNNNNSSSSSSSSTCNSSSFGKNNASVMGTIKSINGETPSTTTTFTSVGASDLTMSDKKRKLDELDLKQQEDVVVPATVFSATATATTTTTSLPLANKWFSEIKFVAGSPQSWLASKLTNHTDAELPWHVCQTSLKELGWTGTFYYEGSNAPLFFPPWTSRTDKAVTKHISGNYFVSSELVLNVDYFITFRQVLKYLRHRSFDKRRTDDHVV